MTDTVTRLMQLAEEWVGCAYNVSKYQSTEDVGYWLDESAKAEKALREALEQCLPTTTK